MTATLKRSVDNTCQFGSVTHDPIGTGPLHIPDPIAQRSSDWFSPTLQEKRNDYNEGYHVFNIPVFE
jgi:hypothetical protein